MGGRPNLRCIHFALCLRVTLAGATQTLLDGVPTSVGWVEYLQMLGGFGCLGALGALVFWVTLKISGAFRFQ